MLGMRVGIDFGSSSTIMYVDGKGIVLDEPTMIAVDTETGIPIAIGNAAYNINGRTDETISVISPVQNGIISDYTMAEHILRYYFQRLCKNSIFKRHFDRSECCDQSPKAYVFRCCHACGCRSRMSCRGVFGFCHWRRL